MAGGVRKGDAGVLTVPPPSPSGPWHGGGGRPLAVTEAFLM